MRAAIYARVSTKDQAEEGFSISAQLRALRDYCQTHGWEIVAEYVDEGLSAAHESAASRPQFRRLMADVEARRFDVIVVHKLDRFSRNLIVTLQSLARIDKAGATFVSLTEQIDYTTPMGRLCLTMIGGLAQWYSDNLASEVRKGRRERIDLGLPNGDLAFGYVSTGDSHQPPVVVKAEAELVREMFRRYAAGTQSANQIAAWLNEQGARPRSKRGLTKFTKAAVMEMLSNPFYAGRVRYKGEELPGRHEACVSEELFTVVQAIRVSRRSNPSGLRAHPSRTYMFRSIARCVRCGRQLICTPDKQNRRYRDTSAERHEPCGWKRQSIFADGVEEQMGLLLRRMILPPDWREKLIEASADKQGVDVERRRRAIQDRLSRLKELRLDGDISKGRYDTEKAGLTGELQSLDAMRSPVSSPAEVAVELAQYAAIWDYATAEERADIVRSMFETVYLDMDKAKVVMVKPRPPFLPLMQVLSAEGLLFGDPDRIRTDGLHRDRVAC